VRDDLSLNFGTSTNLQVLNSSAGGTIIYESLPFFCFFFFITADTCGQNELHGGPSLSFMRHVHSMYNMTLFVAQHPQEYPGPVK
jgi:hypothetical protein